MDFLNLKARRQLTPEARERMRAGQYKGLLRAVAKRKADCSANYAPNFDHGQTAPDFERSAEAAGETREAVRSHLSLADRALLILSGFFARSAPPPRLPLQSDAASPRAPKLVRALALLLWRPLRLFRTQAHWEWLALCYRLRQLVRWRQRHGDLTVECVEEFHQQLNAIIHNYDSELNGRLKRIEGRFWKVWGLYRSLVGVVETVFGARGSGEETRDSGSQITDCEDRPPNSDPRALDPESRASVPEPHPLLQFRGTPHYKQFHPTWADRIDELAPEAIADPFQSPSHTLKAQQQRTQTAAVKEPKLWQECAAPPRLPEREPREGAASHLSRYPAERDLRRMVRSGELTVPATVDELADLVQAALGPMTRSPLAMQNENHGSRSTTGSDCSNPAPCLRSLAESLWDRLHVLSTRSAQLLELLEATLLWDSHRFLALWLNLLPVEYGHEMVSLFRRTHGPGREDIAWGDPESCETRQNRGQPRPAIVPRSEAEEHRTHAGELQAALRVWFVAAWYALVLAVRSSQKTTVALYEWAVSRFGIREEFVVWRPHLSLNQLDARRHRPEWAVRVVTATGKTLVKLKDGRVLEPAARC